MDTRTESADPGQTRCQLARRPEEQKQKECRTPASGERARSFHDTFSRDISLGCVLSFARSRLRVATVALNNLDPLRNRHGLPVGAVRRQRVEHVGNTEDANLQRDRLAAQCVGIARAVPTLMVMPDPAQARMQERGIFYHLMC